jgi:rubredoxin
MALSNNICPDCKVGRMQYVRSGYCDPWDCQIFKCERCGYEFLDHAPLPKEIMKINLPLR